MNAHMNYSDEHDWAADTNEALDLLDRVFIGLGLWVVIVAVWVVARG